MDQGIAALLVGGMGLVGAVSGALAGGFGAIRGALLSANRAAESAERQHRAEERSEHVHWLREERRKAAVEFSAAATDVVHTAVDAWEQTVAEGWSPDAFRRRTNPSRIRMGSASSAVEVVGWDALLEAKWQVQVLIVQLLRELPAAADGRPLRDVAEALSEEADQALDRFNALLRDEFLRPVGSNAEALHLQASSTGGAPAPGTPVHQHAS